MSIVLLKELEEKYKDSGLGKGFFYRAATSGLIPAMRIGSPRGRWVFDTELVEEKLRELMSANIKKSEPVDNQYGKIRRIGI